MAEAIYFMQDGKKYNLYDLPRDFIINTDVNLSKLGLTKLPNLSNVVVNGDFNCSHNNLRDLEGAPRVVNGDFWCGSNKLTSLYGGPKIVVGWFNCDNNNLQNLNYSPVFVDGEFDCSCNQLTDL